MDPALTERESEVAALIARGMTNRQIAAELVIAVGTAQRHVANIMTKLEVDSRTQVATWVVERDQARSARYIARVHHVVHVPLGGRGYGAAYLTDETGAR